MIEQRLDPTATVLEVSTRLSRYLGTSLSVVASLTCSLLYAHLLMIVYMHENNFFSYDYVSRAGLSLELMYLQFELVAVILAAGVAGAIPVLTYVYYRWQRWQRSETRPPEEKRSIKTWLAFGAITLAANVISVAFTLRVGRSAFEFWFLGFAVLVALIATVVYCVQTPIPRWMRLIGCFAALGMITVLCPQPFAELVGQALRRARLGGDLVVSFDYVDARRVSKNDLIAARDRVQKAMHLKSVAQTATVDDTVFGGESAFDCVARGNGYLVLDAPEHLYVRTSADPCDDADSASNTGKDALFVQVIDKSRLRQYRLYRTSGG